MNKFEVNNFLLDEPQKQIGNQIRGFLFANSYASGIIYQDKGVSFAYDLQ